MKRKHLLMAFLSVLLINVWSCVPAAAQNNIDRLVKELEDKGVDVNTVVKRNAKTKQVYSMIKTLTFYSKEGNYARQLQQAFDKDSENASSVNTDRRNTYRNTILSFKLGKKILLYNLIIRGKESQPQVMVSIISRDKSIPQDDDHSSIFFGGKLMDIPGLSSFKWDGKELEALNNIDWDVSGLQVLKNYDWSSFKEQMKNVEKEMKGMDMRMQKIGKGLKDFSVDIDDQDAVILNDGSKIVTRKK